MPDLSDAETCRGTAVASSSSRGRNARSPDERVSTAVNDVSSPSSKSSAQPPASIRNLSPRYRDQGMLRQKLRETISEREVLDARIHVLRTELRFCRTSQQALVEMEWWLAKEIAELEASEQPQQPLPQLEEFLANGVPTGLADNGLGSPKPTVAEATRHVRSVIGPESSRRSWPQALGQIVRGKLSPQTSPRNKDARAVRSPTNGRDTAKAISRVTVKKELHTNFADAGQDTATCKNCGMRFPIEPALIEAHVKSCKPWR